jgi:hypothetical protein
MRYYSLVYAHHDGSLCEFRRFSRRETAENCAEMLNQACLFLSGDEERRFFGVIHSDEFTEWPADCTGILEIDRDASFERPNGTTP